LAQEGSSLHNQGAFMDLLDVVEGHKPLATEHAFARGGDVASWRALMVAAAERDVFTTGNVSTPNATARADRLLC
jgi:glucose-6-phosphate isomerase